jgi:hypothetical protein
MNCYVCSRRTIAEIQTVLESASFGEKLYIYIVPGLVWGGVKKGEGPGTGVNPYESGWVHKLSHVFAVYFLIVLCLNF